MNICKPGCATQRKIISVYNLIFTTYLQGKSMGFGGKGGGIKKQAKLYEFWPLRKILALGMLTHQVKNVQKQLMIKERYKKMW